MQGEAQLRLVRSNLTSNTAGKNGGGVCVKSGRLDVVGSNFEGNVAVGMGGGLHVGGAAAEAIHPALVAVARTQFQHNRILGGGLSGANVALSDVPRGGANFTSCGMVNGSLAITRCTASQIVFRNSTMDTVRCLRVLKT